MSYQFSLEELDELHELQSMLDAERKRHGIVPGVPFELERPSISISDTVDWRRIKDDKEKYAAYLCSREWSEKKEAVRRRSDGKCERCRRNPLDAVHHLTYIRKYSERLSDLQAICNQCHEFTHGKSDYDPRVQP